MIVFVVGGGNYLEYQNLKDYMVKVLFNPHQKFLLCLKPSQIGLFIDDFGNTLLLKSNSAQFLSSVIEYVAVKVVFYFHSQLFFE